MAKHGGWSRRSGGRPRVLLTGPPGCGKTTVVRRAVEAIGAGRCAGFYTEEVREGGRRVGFDVVTLAGERVALARVGGSGPKLGRYGVDVTAFEGVGVAALEEGLAGEVPIVVVDEIGKMELFSERFITLLAQLFDPMAAHALLGTVMERSHPTVDALRQRPLVSVVGVTRGNRVELPERLREVFADFLADVGS